MAIKTAAGTFIMETQETARKERQRDSPEEKSPRLDTLEQPDHVHQPAPEPPPLLGEGPEVVTADPTALPSQETPSATTSTDPTTTSLPSTDEELIPSCTSKAPSKQEDEVPSKEMSEDCNVAGTKPGVLVVLF